MEDLEKIIDYLMKKVVYQKERIEFLEKHIDSQNETIMELSLRRHKKTKRDKEETTELPF